MSSNKRHTRRPILSMVMLLGFILSVVAPIYSQQPTDGNAGGGPPQNGERGADQRKDSTEAPKIHKPLESYFFDDSVRAMTTFRWNNSKNYNKIEATALDTALTDWRIDYPFYKEGVGDMALGGLGQSSQAINYFERADYRNFKFAQSYDAYIFDMENTYYTNVKKPFTHFSYGEMGTKRYREVNFGIAHAQNISPTTGFNIDYKSRGTLGQYDRQEISNHNLALNFAHTGKFYTVHASYLNNKIETEESGGVVGSWAIRDTVFDMNIGVPMKLATAEATNTYRNRAFTIDQTLAIPLEPVTDRDFSIAHLSAVYLGHSFEYNQWTKLYEDVYATYTDDRDGIDEDGYYTSAEYCYYDNWYINPSMSRDSIAERLISNRLYVQAQPWNRDGVVGTINAGIGVDLHTYSQFSLDDYLTGQMARDERTSYFGYGAVDGKIKRYVDWGGDFKLYPAGYRGGDYEAAAHIALSAYFQDRPLTLSGELSSSSSSPDYWQENLFSNHFVWFSPLSKENKTRLEAKLEIPSIALELAAWQEIITGKIYYDENSIVAQSGNSISVTGLYARKDFRIGGFHLDHRVLMQMSTDEKVIPLPLFSAYLSYYYEFWVTRDVLRLQIGADTRYTTSYYMPGYNPALAVFYNQREESLGDYPYTDVYVAGKWKRMRIYLKYQHINNGMFNSSNNSYFQVAGYPLNPAMFKMGISWAFYD